MRKIAVYGLIIFLVMLFGATGAIVIGRGRQLPQQYAELGIGWPNCETPCWLGIQPGRTRLIDAEHQVFAAFHANAPYRAVLDATSTEGLRQISLFSRDHDGGVYVTLLAQDDKTVDTVILRFDLIDDHAINLSPRVGDFYETLGEPVRFGYTENTRYSILGYGTNKRGARMFFKPHRRVESTHHLLWLMLYENSTFRTVGPLENLLPWSGFSAAVRYMDRLNLVRNSPLIKTGAQ
jgi:hypothetical protein